MSTNIYCCEVNSDTLQNSMEDIYKALGNHKPGGDRKIIAGSVLGTIVESFQLIVPAQANGSTVVHEDYIEWTCDEGLVQNTREGYRAIMIPAPDDAPYYCGFIQVDLCNIENRMKNLGYFNLEDKVPDFLDREVGISSVLSAMITAQRRGEEADYLTIAEQWSKTFLKRLNISKINFYGLSPKFFTDVLCRSCFVEELNLDAFKEDPVRRIVSLMYGLEYIDNPMNVRGVYVVPKWLYEANRALATKGWGPVTPQWLKDSTYQFNYGLFEGCLGDIVGINTFPKLSEPEVRIFSAHLAGNTLHVPTPSMNYTTIRPPKEWEELAEEQIRLLASGEAGTKFNWHESVGFGLEMCRNIPIIIYRGDNSPLSYYRVHLQDPESKYTHTKINISETDAVGTPLYKVSSINKSPTATLTILGNMTGCSTTQARIYKAEVAKELERTITLKNKYGTVKGVIIYAKERMTDGDKDEQGNGKDNSSKDDTTSEGTAGVIDRRTGVPTVPD